MRKSYRPAGTRTTRPPRCRPGLFVTIDGSRPVVRVLASDLFEQRALEDLARLVEHVLGQALRREAGTA